MKRPIAIPESTKRVRIEDVLVPLEDGRKIHQGWSPQCEKGPSSSDQAWGVLKTTSIQANEFFPEHNKLLPPTLQPRPLLEVKPGDILITCAGPRSRCGVSCLVEETRKRLIISGKMYRFRTRPEIMLPEYLVYFLQSEEATSAIDSMKTGGNESGLNLTHERFRQLSIPLVPLEQQRNVVKTLRSCFQQISKAKQNARTSLHLTTVLFDRKLEEAFRNSSIQWEQTTLETVLEVQPQNGWSPPESERADIGTPVLTLSAVTGYYFRPEKIKHTSAITDPRKKYWVKNGDLLITRSNSSDLVGHVAIAEGIAEPTIFPDLIMRMIPHPDRALAEFLYFQLRSPSLRAEIAGRALGANPTMKKINNASVRTLPIFISDLSTQAGIVSNLKALDENIRCLDSVYVAKVAKLDALKASLLHSAFSGNH